MYDLLLLKNENVTLVEEGIFDREGVDLYIAKFLYDNNIKNASKPRHGKEVKGVWRISVGLVEPVFVAMSREKTPEEEAMEQEFGDFS